MNSQMLSEVEPVLTFVAPKLDTSKVLWFCRSILDVSAWQENAVALATGAEFSDLSKCQRFFAQFKGVFLAMPESQEREALEEAVSEYCPFIPVLVPRRGAFRESECVEDMLDRYGVTAVDHLIDGAIERPLHVLLDVADVQKTGIENEPAVLSGIRELDMELGGFYGGELSVWTGKRGSGKSNFLGQLILEAVERGHRVFAFSGELSAAQFRNWIYQQAAGAMHINPVYDDLSGKTFWTVDPDAERRITEWMRGKLFLYDNSVSSGNSEEGLLSVMRYAVRRYGCCVYLIDNLMTVQFDTTKENDFYRSQGAFAGRLVEFAQRYGVHVHLVAHPRKGDGKTAAIDADDVGGSGDVTNRAHNVFAIQRLTTEQAQKQGYQSVLRVLKNRNFGASIAIGLDYDSRSRRFYKAGNFDRRHYGWEA